MSHQSELIATDIDSYLKQHEQKELLRFLTCGSVDDGKSTLIGRLFFDAKFIYEDTLAQIEQDSVQHGTTGGGFDPALFTDGLKEEREQGITIDVAYRYFSTAKRKFIIADTPGHEQFTRNMATGASSCDLAVILIDARHGVIEQTKRHSFIVSLLGIKHVLVAVNKMDLVDYSEEVYNKIREDYQDFSRRLNIGDLHFIPISALLGDNIVDPSENMDWYQGQTLMTFLDSVYIGSDRNLVDFRFPVQYVNRPNLDFRGFCGTIASGIVRKGDDVMILPSRKRTQIKSIVTHDGELDEAFSPQAVTLTLEDEIDCARGDMIVRPDNIPKVEQKFEAMIVWMDENKLKPGQQYLFKHTTKTVPGSISTLRYRVDVNTLHSEHAPTLALNEIGRCSINLTKPIFFDAYARNRNVGSFIIIDRISNITVGAGMIVDRKSGDDQQDFWDSGDVGVTGLKETKGHVSPDERQARFGQRPCTLLLTGLTGSGKTTIAFALERRLFDEGHAATVIDGHNLRIGLTKDLGFNDQDRSENLRRSVEVARMMNKAGMICICAFVAPNREVRQRVKDVINEDQLLIVHVSAPLEVCRKRDPNGLYGKADAGEISNFPGVSAEYEPPLDPDLVLETDKKDIDQCVDDVVKLLESKGLFL